MSEKEQTQRLEVAAYTNYEQPKTRQQKVIFYQSLNLLQVRSHKKARQLRIRLIRIRRRQRLPDSRTILIWNRLKLSSKGQKKKKKKMRQISRSRIRRLQDERTRKDKPMRAASSLEHQGCRPERIPKGRSSSIYLIGLSLRMRRNAGSRAT